MPKLTPHILTTLCYYLPFPLHLLYPNPHHKNPFLLSNLLQADNIDLGTIVQEFEDYYEVLPLPNLVLEVST